MKHTCRGCDTTWTGMNMCHCSAGNCHQTFSSAPHFDAHRLRGKCEDPAKLKVKAGTDEHGEPVMVTRLKRNERGVWVGALANPRWTKEDEDDE